MNHHLLTYPHAALIAPALPVTEAEFGTRELRLLIEELIDLMRQHRGVGFAATQIGVAKQVAVIEMDDGAFVFLNPEMRQIAKQQLVDEEGCLSVPGVFGRVSRARSVHVRAFDFYGQRLERKARDFFARVIQHEVDHLNGHLFLERCTVITQGVEEARRLGILLPHDDGAF
ncbi:MAG: peptide deformylase [bacterium]